MLAPMVLSDFVSSFDFDNLVKDFKDRRVYNYSAGNTIFADKYYLDDEKQDKVIYEVPVVGFNKEEIEVYQNKNNQVVIKSELSENSPKRKYLGSKSYKYDPKEFKVNIPKGFDVDNIYYEAGQVIISFVLKKEDTQIKKFDL